MPTTTGTYTVRLYAGTRLLATSGPITVAFSSDISIAITPATVVARGMSAERNAHGHPRNGPPRGLGDGDSR